MFYSFLCGLRMLVCSALVRSEGQAYQYSLRKRATSLRPASRSGGLLQTCAVTTFWGFVDALVWRTFKNASQIALTFEVSRRSRMLCSADGAPPSSSSCCSSLGALRVSLYIVSATSCSLEIVSLERSNVDWCTHRIWDRKRSICTTFFSCCTKRSTFAMNCFGA